jgi:murein DD-endopeptidase MepM/ murein hydrolase activator NlpD
VSRARGVSAAVALVAAVGAAPLLAQSSAGDSGRSLDGRWQGAIGAAPNQLRLRLELSKAPDGLLLGTLVSIDQGGSSFPIDVARQSGDTLHLEWRSINASFTGVLSADRTRLAGTWTQGRSTPLSFERIAAPAAATAVAAPATAAVPATAATPAPPSPPNPVGILADVATPIAPTPFTTGGKTQLVYEVHITNFGGGEMLVSRLDVLDGSATLASFEGRELNSMMAQPRLNVADTRSIPPATRAVAYLWVTIDSGKAIPRTLRHRLTVGTQTLEADAVTVGAASPVVVSAPLRGGDWLAANGPGNASGHRRALIALDGKPRIAQRFAIDWVKVGSNGATFSGNAKDNASYFAYGLDVISVADGVVASVKDGIPENVPGPTSRAVPITNETVGGNYVIVDIGGGKFAFYAHLKPGSLKVKTGDRVRRGQLLGLLGNSGNSTEPHLHFHISNANSPLGSEGLPYLIDTWELGGTSGAWTAQRNQLTMLNARVRFK